MVWEWVKRIFRGDLLGSAKTEGYRKGDRQSTAMLFHFQERPIFTLTTAELMEFDSKVTLGLAIRNGLLKQGRVNVVGGNPDVCKFVKSQWSFLWQSFGAKFLRTKNYGFQGFEVLFREDPNRRTHLCVSGLKDFHPRDTRPLIAEGSVVGITVGGVRGSNRGKVPLWAPKSLWLTFRDRHGSNFGESLLEHAYAPWHEKWQRGGAVKLRQMRMQKDAWIGDIIRYPANKKVILPTGETVTYRDIARELVELRASGGVMGLPSDRDQAGNLLFEYTPPQQIDGATMMFDYGDRLDNEIIEGLEVPKEVAQAAETGSGFSGRSIPFIALLSVLQEEFDDLVHQIDRQVLRPLCRLNYGVEPTYQIMPQSLVETVGKLMGGEGDGPHDTGGGPEQTFGGPPGGFRGGILPTSSSGGNSGNGNGQLSDAPQFAPRAHVYRDRISPRRAPVFGCTVGGVFVPGGKWIGSASIQLASDEELDFIDGRSVVQLAEQKKSEGRWITIGGRPGEDGKKHVGGFPVQISSDGTILAGGPPGLRGRHVSGIKEYFDEERSKREESGDDGFGDIAAFFEEASKEVAGKIRDANPDMPDAPDAEPDASNPDAPAPVEVDEVNDPDAPGNTKSYNRIVDFQAKKWGMTPENYQQISDELFREVAARTREVEAAREYIRKRTGLRIPRIAQLERQGKDYSHVSELDVIGREVASLYPVLGWGQGFEDQGTGSEQEYDRLAWELVKEGQQRISKVSKRFHQEVDGYIQDQLSQFGSSYVSDEYDKQAEYIKQNAAYTGYVPEHLSSRR